ncbi:MAG: Crp/Fnr family transcriptional regulator [Burkholderiales bacterium]|nr:Crp/Fnr family transcriptional regulator [Burkholderiales bacterium]
MKEQGEKGISAILGGAGRMRHFQKGSIVLHEGDPSTSLYIIHSGRLKAFLSDDQGREIVISIMEPGEYFGEMAIIDNGTRSASVMAIEDAQLSVISREDFQQYLSVHPELSHTMMLGLIRRLRNATRKIGSLALLDVYGRVAGTLLQFAREEEGTLMIQERLTHQEIANMVGASREMVTRIMHDLVADGYISVDEKRRIVIHEKTGV